MNILIPLFENLQRIAKREDIIDIILIVIASYILLIWIGLIIWTMVDTYRRSRNILFFLLAFILATTLNIFGVLIYLLIRPPQPLSQKYLEERELEHFMEQFSCPHCSGPMKDEFKYCPYCLKKVRFECKKCHKLADSTWDICAYCGTKLKKK